MDVGDFCSLRGGQCVTSGSGTSRPMARIGEKPIRSEGSPPLMINKGKSLSPSTIKKVESAKNLNEPGTGCFQEPPSKSPASQQHHFSFEDPGS